MRDATARGATLVEALVALALLGIALAGIVPSFITQLDANSHNEQRAAGVAAAERVLDGLRLITPATLPDSGASAPQLVAVGTREYEVTTHYCVRPELCGDEMRHLRIEVRLAGREIYDVETVYTRLR